MQRNGPYTERSGAIVDATGRIEVAAYERRGDEFNGTSPYLVEDAIICPLFVPGNRGHAFLEWMQKNKVDCFCLTSSGIHKHARMDRHWSSEYTSIECAFGGYNSKRKPEWVAVGFSDPEAHAEARYLFGSLKLDIKLETPIQWGNQYVA